jgi:hypothetical protein
VGRYQSTHLNTRPQAKASGPAAADPLAQSIILRHLRESSSERATLAADLPAASPQERLDWLTQREAAAARASQYYERIESTTHRVRPEDEHHHRPDRDITPDW